MYVIAHTVLYTYVLVVCTYVCVYVCTFVFVSFYGILLSLCTASCDLLVSDNKNDVLA